MKKFIIFFAAFLLIITVGCKKNTTPTKDGYIKASVEFICYTIENPKLIDNEESTTNKLKEIFKKYDFPVDDNEKMKALISEFSKDQTTVDAISSETEKCAAKYGKTDNNSAQTNEQSTDKK